MVQPPCRKGPRERHYKATIGVLDFLIQTDHRIECCRPDLLLVEKKTKEAWIIDVAVPRDSGINIAEQAKIERYQDLIREI